MKSPFFSIRLGCKRGMRVNSEASPDDWYQRYQEDGRNGERDRLSHDVTSKQTFFLRS